MLLKIPLALLEIEIRDIVKDAFYFRIEV